MSRYIISLTLLLLIIAHADSEDDATTCDRFTYFDEATLSVQSCVALCSRSPHAPCSKNCADYLDCKREQTNQEKDEKKGYGVSTNQDAEKATPLSVGVILIVVLFVVGAVLVVIAWKGLSSRECCTKREHSEYARHEQPV